MTYFQNMGQAAESSRPDALAAARALRDASRWAEAAAAFNDAGLALLSAGSPLQALDAFADAEMVAVEVTDVSMVAAAAANQGLAAMRAGRLPIAEAHLARSLRLLADLRSSAAGPMRDVDAREANVRMLFGVLLRRLNRLDGARAQYVEAAQLYRAWNMHDDLLDVANNLAVLDERGGDLAGARQRLTAVLDSVPADGDPLVRARAWTTLSAVLAQQGEFTPALQHLEDASRIYLARRALRELADVRTNQGYVRMHVGALTAARAHLEEAAALYEHTQAGLDLARVFNGLGSLELRVGNQIEALERFAIASVAFEHLDLARELANSYVNRGVAHINLEEWEPAQALLNAALTVYAEADPEPPELAVAEHNLGVALAGAHDLDRAQQHYENALLRYERDGRIREAADIHMNLGIIATARGRPDIARQFYTQALDAFGKMKLWQHAARCRLNEGLTWPAEAEERRSLVLPAWLALDSARYGLRGPAERAFWRDTLGNPAAAAFDSAELGGAFLLAELVENARSAGRIAALAVPLTEVTGLVGVGPAALPSVADQLPMSAAPLVDCGWRSALEAYRASAQQLLVDAGPAAPGPQSVVRLEELVTAPSGTGAGGTAGVAGEPRFVSSEKGAPVEEVVPTAWWLGYWRAGDRLYWWTTVFSAAATRSQLKAYVRSRVSPTTWQQAGDDHAATRPAALHAGTAGADGAFVAAGSLLWADVEPLLAELARAVPVLTDPRAQQDLALADRNARRTRERAALAARISGEPANDTDVAQTLADLIAAELRRRNLNAAAVNDSLSRAWAGPLVDPSMNTRLFAALGELLLPDLLREYLTALAPHERESTTLVIAPGPELGLVPWELLVVNDDDRLIEFASLRGGISPATVADLALPAAPDRPEAPGLAVLDAAGRRSPEGLRSIYPHGIPDGWQRGDDANVPATGTGPDAAAGLTRTALSAALGSRDWGRLLIHGHVTPGDLLNPSASALVFAPSPGDETVTTADGRALEDPRRTHLLTARAWLAAPRRWPMPRRVGIIACQADDAGYVEQTGLTLAALNAGARVVTSTRWPLPADAVPRPESPADGEAPDSAVPPGATTMLALAVDRALASPDPVRTLRAWQCEQLGAWRRATTPEQRRAHAPLLWASLVTYVMPDAITMHDVQATP